VTFLNRGNVMVYQHKKVLIVVKTYPTPARKGVEVSCTAGITEDGKLIRLFPLPFRSLRNEKQFKKYQWIEVAVTKASDPRPDSWVVDLESIKVLGDPLPTSDSWQARKNIVLSLLSPSLCHLVRNREKTGATLGIFKPKEIKGLIIEPEELATWTERELNILSQESMFDRKPPNLLEKIPYKFIYSFTCDDSDCREHRLSVVDWEVAQSYRSWRKCYGNQWEQPFRQRFETQMIHKYDTHFYVGTLRAHPDRWIIIGLFYPPRSTWNISSGGVK
jgi:hypothetical protein